MLFNKKKTEQVESAESPYLNARRAWNAHEGEILVSRKLWQIVALLALITALSAVSGLIYIGQQPKFIPYIVEVDKLGEAVGVGLAAKASVADDRILRAMLASFVADSRMVTPDVAVQRKAVFQVYALLNQGDPAFLKMNEYMNGADDRNPFKRASKEMVTVQIVSVLPQSEETWLVDWIEEIRDRQGAFLRRDNMRALLNIYLASPSSKITEEQILRNPLGLFVKDFNWTRKM